MKTVLYAKMFTSSSTEVRPASSTAEEQPKILKLISISFLFSKAEEHLHGAKKKMKATKKKKKEVHLRNDQHTSASRNKMPSNWRRRHGFWS